jgi:hypothetical protein
MFCCWIVLVGRSCGDHLAIGILFTSDVEGLFDKEPAARTDSYIADGIAQIEKFLIERSR